MYEDKTSPNDALAANHSNDEDTTENAEATTETELEAEQADSSEGGTVTLSRAELEEREKEIRKEQDRRWKDRIKGLESKEGSQESREESGTPKEGLASRNEITISRLEARGIFDKQKQNEVLTFMEREGITDVAEAVESDYVQYKLKKVDEEAEKGRATQSPINRTGKPREKTPEELAKMAEEGNLPKTKEERRAALKALQTKYGRTNG